MLGAADSPAETKLRETLRNATLQMRTLQNERDTLQAAKTQLEQEHKAALQKAEALGKQLAEDKTASDKVIAELKAKTSEQQTQLAQLEESVEKWKAAQQKSAELATAKEAERAKLAGQVIELQRRVADQQTKNAAMFKIGNEILSRYEKFGLGTALTAREPFVGTMRVKLQNLVQDYGDKLAEQKIKPEAATESQATPVTRRADKPGERKTKPERTQTSSRAAEGTRAAR
jgi:chromosome segregation ATPase